MSPPRLLREAAWISVPIVALTFAVLAFGLALDLRLESFERVALDRESTTSSPVGFESSRFAVPPDDETATDHYDPTPDVTWTEGRGLEFEEKGER